MAQTNMMAGRLIQPNQGLSYDVKESFKTLSFDLFAGISIIYVGMLMIIGRATSHDTILETMACVLFALTWIKGNHFHHLVISFASVKNLPLVVICMLGLFMKTSGAQPLIDQNEELQSCPLVDSEIWEIIHRSVKSTPALALLIGLLILGGAIVALRAMFEYRLSVPEVLASVAPVAPAPVPTAAAVAAPAAIAAALAPAAAAAPLAPAIAAPVAAAVPAVVAAAPVVPAAVPAAPVVPAAPAGAAGPLNPNEIDEILRDDPEHPNRRGGRYPLWPKL